MKFGLVMGFGLGALTAYLAAKKVKSSVMDEGKQMLKDKIIKILD